MHKSDFAQYLKESSILIIETNKDSCDNLINQLVQMGADFKSIYTCNNKEEARVYIEGMDFQIIFSEYGQISIHGFELFNFAKEKMGTNLLTFVLTSNNSQITVASAAEEEVSDYLLKPVTFKAIQEVVERNYLILKNKNKYMEKISLGKAQLKQKNLDDAEKLFEEAETLHEAPSLACYYLGQVSFHKGNKMMEVAHYNRGLRYNAFHYRCLCAVMDFYRKENKFDLSYKILKKLVEFFPASNDRLCLAVHTSIRLAKFDEIKGFYDTYAKITDVTPELQGHIEAGLYILAKYKIITKHYEDAEIWMKEICRIGVKREFYMANLYASIVKYWHKDDVHKIIFSLSPILIENKISADDVFKGMNELPMTA